MTEQEFSDWLDRIFAEANEMKPTEGCTVYLQSSKRECDKLFANRPAQPKNKKD